MDQNIKDLADEFVNSLKGQLQELGHDLKVDADDLRLYAAQRLEVVKASAGEPNFREGLVAERDALALKAAGKAIDQADNVDARIWSVADTFLSVASRALLLI